MKKIIALLAVFVLCFNLSYTQPVRADTFSIPFSAIPDLLNAFYTVASGGKIEFSALIGNITGIDDFWQNLHEYYDTHYTQPLLQSTQGLIDIGLSSLALNGISSIDNINGFTVPVTAQDLANFMSFDVNWTNNYADSNGIVISPDADFYQSILDVINKRDNTSINSFWWYDFNTVINSPDLTSYISPFSTCSWFCKGNVYSISPGFNSSYVFACATNPLSINIISSGSVYSYSVSCTNIQPANINRYNGVESPAFSFDFNSSNWSNLDLGISYTQPFTTSYSGSLGQVLQDISYKFKNVNIYVDGELWSYAGDVPSPGISLNDYTEVGDTGIITYGVFPLTSTGDIGLDIAKWGEYIYNQCISGDGTLTMDTVIDDGWDLVDTDDGTRAITTEDEEDVAKVIHGFVGNTATTPTPTPDIGDPPILKIIPPILELPDEIWPDGGRDTTVLAQIIHSTDVIMPNDIMTILWSILGIMVIGGLLTILHK